MQRISHNGKKKVGSHDKFERLKKHWLLRVQSVKKNYRKGEKMKEKKDVIDTRLYNKYIYAVVNAIILMYNFFGSP